MRVGKLCAMVCLCLVTALPAMAGVWVSAPGSASVSKSGKKRDKKANNRDIRSSSGDTEDIDGSFTRAPTVAGQHAPSVGEVRARLQLARLRILIVAMTISLCPLILLSALRTYEILQDDQSEKRFEKSSNSLFLVIICILLLAFGCWYGYIPMSCTGGPVSNNEALEAPLTPTSDDQPQIKDPITNQQVATTGVDLSYHSLDNQDLSNVARAPDDN